MAPVSASTNQISAPLRAPVQRVWLLTSSHWSYPPPKTKTGLAIPPPSTYPLKKTTCGVDQVCPILLQPVEQTVSSVVSLVKQPLRHFMTGLVGVLTSKA